MSADAGGHGEQETAAMEEGETLEELKKTGKKTVGKGGLVKISLKSGRKLKMLNYN